MNPTWSLQVFLRSCTVAFANERLMHSWWTWGILWMGRLVAEISFFALIGRMIGDERAVAFLLVGAAMLSPAYATMFVAQSVRSMMYDGLVPYLIASPAPAFPAALGRSIHWCVDGVIAGSLGLIIGNQVFDLGFSVVEVVALVVLATRFPRNSNMLAALARALLGLLCGATFAVTFLPGWLQPVSEAIPLTHLVRAARNVTGDGAVAGDLARAAVVGAIWLLAAHVLVRCQFERSRRSGRFV